MTNLSFILLGLFFVLVPCEAQLKLTPGNAIYNVNPGDSKSLTWQISGANMSDLNTRVWGYGPQVTLLADINDRGEVTIHGTRNIPASNIEVKPPSTLIIKNVNDNFNGTYTFGARLKTSANQEQSAVVVFVTKKPTVTFSCPSVNTVNEGDNFTCECRGENGNPSADVTWYDKDDNQIGGTAKEKNKLFRRSVRGEDSGKYKCKAQSYTLFDEKSVELIVNFTPTEPDFEELPNTIYLGGIFTMACKSEGLPEPTYTIVHNNTETVSNETTYTITGVNWSDEGNYTCIVQNILGNDSATEYLNVKEKKPTTTETTSTKPTVASNGSVKTTDDDGKGGLGGGEIAGIIIGVLFLIVIVVVIVYMCCCKTKQRNGYKGNAGVNPRNERELEDSPGGDNAYDTVNNGGGSGGKKNPEKETLPAVYAKVNKESKEGKPLYASLDHAMGPNDSQKRGEDRPEPTQYASIDFGRQADLV